MTTENIQADDAGKDPELRAALRLALTSGVGPRIRQALVERFGSAEAVWQAPPSELADTPGVGPKLLQNLARAHDQIDIDAEFERCREHDIQIIARGDSRYPRMLGQIDDPPGVLFVRGALTEPDNLAIGIVGARHATRYGLAQAERLAGGLTRIGFTIVSGLARGVDGAAHRGALAAGGRTLSVLASGLLRIYPPEHAGLADEVAQRGALVSEAAPLSEPVAGAFPQRNRLITGLSLGVIIVEAAERSGALISARHAMEQNREVFAVPGRVDSRMSRGPHRLIRDGAKLVETVDDVLEELGPLVEPAGQDDGGVVHHPAELQLNELEKKVLGAIDSEPVSIDTVVAETGLPVARVLSTVNVLEMRRLVRRAAGAMIARM